MRFSLSKHFPFNTIRLNQRILHSSGPGFLLISLNRFRQSLRLFWQVLDVAKLGVLSLHFTYSLLLPEELYNLHTLLIPPTSTTSIEQSPTRLKKSNCDKRQLCYTDRRDTVNHVQNFGGEYSLRRLRVHRSSSRIMRRSSFAATLANTSLCLGRCLCQSHQRGLRAITTRFRRRRRRTGNTGSVEVGRSSSSHHQIEQCFGIVHHQFHLFNLPRPIIERHLVSSEEREMSITSLVWTYRRWQAM